MGAKSLDLLAEEEVVKLVLLEFVASEFGGAFLVELDVLLVVFHFLNGFVQNILAGVFVLNNLLRGQSCLVSVLAQVVGRGHVEQVCVECWHLRLNVVEQVGLLHVASVDLHGHFIEELSKVESFFRDLFLGQSHLDLAVHLVEGLQSFFGESVCVDGVQAEVAFAQIVDDEDGVLEFLRGLKGDAQNLMVEALPHARVDVEADLVCVHELLGLILHSAQQIGHLTNVCPRHGLRDQETVHSVSFLSLGNSHQEAFCTHGA